jgi:hypothetical protein
MDRLNEIIRRVADERPSAVMVDLPAYLSDQPGGEMDEGLRSDGVHFDLETAYEVSTNWLGQAVLDGIDAEPNPAAPPRQPPVVGRVVPPVPEDTPA